ncbi:MAG: DNA polymerase III subunit beta [Candidatus Doudnabacteria bacterium RIFCSPHIGHO2_01_FULL_49_9]|uniref:Beta sliding clamp n=1 Tax=Candidatus Doudnabacteria bacterium RIFCSPHIGHO2_01_FULL_49_9 TaxID=1817827 RepID=A0A1F5P359_9BACT|nr:MAG: DNA polymerase III subunit beta [Candidatus Doudnabacteria bacterium RIFCSPHIGHO2_01_FULL_49_9]
MVCTKKNLNTGLIITSRIIGSGNSLPILNNILFKTEEGRLRLSGTNLEMAINTWVGGKIEEEGEITVPARLVNDYVNNIIAEKITINSKNQTLSLEAEKAQTHIKGLPSEEFPLIPKIKEGIFTKIDGKELSKTIKEVGFASSFSETQPEISGILFVFEGDTLTLAATDRYRLTEGKVKLITPISSQKQIIVPSRAVIEAARIMGSGVVEIFLGEGQICFRSPEVELVSRLIEGQYPDYKQIIPKSFTTEAEINREQFSQSLKAASLFSSENNNIELELNPQTRQVIIKTQTAQVGDSEIKLDAVISGEKNSIIFNYRYLLECLTNISDEKVVLKIISSASPAAIVPLGRDNYTYIVMPIKI